MTKNICLDDLHGSELTKAKHGSDFYRMIGSKGGRKSHGGGFRDPNVASRAGKIGGKWSKKQMVQLV
jgi:general stress protein YciG